MSFRVVILTTLLALASGKLRVDDEGVFLRLFTRQNPSEHQLIEVEDYDSFTATNFNLSNPVKFFTNGRMNAWDVPELINAFLANGDVNVVMVDWSSIANTTDEGVLIASAQTSGRRVSGFLDWIYTYGYSFSNVHIIGFSIGSHAAAYQARFCQNGVVEYLTGLDPAISDYELGGDHINANDARYVEVFHTSNGGGNSFRDPLGTADFYPNGGEHQPGCVFDLCDHNRALTYFVESINSNEFVGSQCNNYEEVLSGECANLSKGIMGTTGSAKTISGLFLLTTNDRSPFALGDV